MIVGLHDSDRKNKGSKFPNYALMKISAYHKSINDTVEWWDAMTKCNVVYSSKIFDFKVENEFLPENTIKGGTGYDIKKVLPQEIDNIFPDYSIYPNCDYAIGFLTRGCINNCSFCVVPEKEGYIRPYRAWEQIKRIDTNIITFMDNNVLAIDYGIEQMQLMIGKNLIIDFNQGMDARLMTSDVAEIISKLNWQKYIRFSCDGEYQIPYIFKTVEMLKKFGVKSYRLFIYTIIKKDLEEAERRISELKKIKNISIYAQPEINAFKGIIPNKAQNEYAQRYIFGRSYLKETWKEYCKRTGFKEPQYEA
jgi:hypothetical protein